ncbi:hypothetical protein M1B72_08955 [Geomonas paludis]|uniref:ClpX-type ZB domain-containing protein n=1 Tax=Geomonas paludis TaxID=2740185 RepID=A0ABY4LIJ3_9BACT|nr:hypothetical protein [Geomonas paludis]UPU37818.1 hypothetical protein M1B72_08955 [Geomonas paludis]
MSEDYYCPLCGNKPFGSFVRCRILEQPVCTECDAAIRHFFLDADQLQSPPPQVVERLSDYSGLCVQECAEIWHKEQLVASLLKLRDGIDYFEQTGDLWDTAILKQVLAMVNEAKEAGDLLPNAANSRGACYAGTV